MRSVLSGIVLLGAMTELAVAGAPELPDGAVQGGHEVIHAIAEGTEIPSDPKGDAQTLPGIHIIEHGAYWVEIPLLPASQFGAGKLGFLVIRGDLRNASGGPLHHVKIIFELLGGDGTVLASEYGYNRAAEGMRPIDDRNRIEPPRIDEVEPLASDANDSFRMLFPGAEAPPFRTYRIRVVEAGPLAP